MLTVLQGERREILKTLPDESGHCCVTSPRFFGLRDYQTEPQVWAVITSTNTNGLITAEQHGCFFRSRSFTITKLYAFTVSDESSG